MDALRFQHEEQRRQQRKAFQELEEECRSAQAERDALQDRFVGEWQRFGGRADQHVASLSAVMSKGRAMRGRRPHASHRVVTPVGRVLTSQERKLASRRREISDPYMSDVCAKLGEIHLPCVPRPPASDTKARTAYDMRALLAAMNSTRKAAVLAGVNDRIVRAQRYRSVYDKITRDILANPLHGVVDHGMRMRRSCPDFAPVDCSRFKLTNQRQTWFQCSALTLRARLALSTLHTSLRICGCSFICVNTFAPS